MTSVPLLLTCIVAALLVKGIEYYAKSIYSAQVLAFFMRKKISLFLEWRPTVISIAHIYYSNFIYFVNIISFEFYFNSLALYAMNPYLFFKLSIVFVYLVVFMFSFNVNILNCDSFPSTKLCQHSLRFYGLGIIL